MNAAIHGLLRPREWTAPRAASFLTISVQSLRGAECIQARRVPGADSLQSISGGSEWGCGPSDVLQSRTGGFSPASMAMCDVTRILGKMEAGDPLAAEQLLTLIYDELRKLACSVCPGFSWAILSAANFRSSS